MHNLGLKRRLNEIETRRTTENRGLTLVEVLVVVAIVGLLMAVLLFYMFPSDDGRCRSEANRLSAYMTAAWAEAVMRDGPARVVFDLSAHSAVREVTRVGADITRSLWEKDKKVGLHQVERPVVIDSVNTTSVPNLQVGLGYMTFNGQQSEGGVIVLRLNEAIYSVVVPARGKIKVERGRSTIPNSTNLQRQKLPDLMGYKSTPGKSKPGMISGGLPPSQPITRRPATTRKSTARPATSAKDVKKIEPTPNSGPQPDDYLPGSPDYPSSPDLSSLQPPVATDKTDPITEPDEPDDKQEPNENENGPCQSYTDCLDDGPWRQCIAGSCRVNPYGRTLMLSNVQTQEPSQLGQVLDALMSDLIAEGEINLMLNLSQPNLWLVQGRRSGSFAGLPKYGQSEDFPTYRSEATLISGCDAGICTATFRPDTDDQSMTLYVRDRSVDDDAQACKYQPLTLIDVSILAAINVQKQPGIVGEQLPGATMTIRGTLRESAARQFDVTSSENLLETLERFSVTANADTVGDGVNDGWEFIFQGAAQTVYFEDDPTASAETVPEYCDQSDE
ncbi:MAG: prepilin-type N-terminal cleavage/methylation domain-containing protein [Myxococcota bacterium]|nr:prepilin-type N-terminal cleavage/methylation domain-containing protein [Myxococcota bacterium]